MTIVVAFHLGDGVVVDADRMLTSTIGGFPPARH